MSTRLTLLPFILLTLACSEPIPQLDCNDQSPDVICDAVSSCNPNTNRCNRQCNNDISKLDSDQKSDCDGDDVCIGGWCIPREDCINEVDQNKFQLPAGKTTCGCTQNSHCTSRLCYIYHTNMDSFLAQRGICIPESSRNGIAYQNIAYVDRDRCTVSANGTKENPFCEIYSAVARNTATQKPFPIRVIASLNRYSGDIFHAETFSPVWIFGPDAFERKYASELGQAVQATIQSPVILDANLSANGNTGLNVILDSVQISNDAQDKDGLSCVATATNQPKLRLRRSIIGSLGQLSTISTASALYVDGCAIEMDRSAIVNNKGNAIEFAQVYKNKPSFSIRNSMIASNALDPTKVPRAGNPVLPVAAVYLTGTGSFEFNTVVGNGNSNSLLKAGVYCRESVTLNRSIIVANRTKDQSQIEACSTNSTATEGSAIKFLRFTFDPSLTGLPKPIVAESDLQLNCTNTACVVATRDAYSSTSPYSRNLDYNGVIRTNPTSIGAFSSQ